MAVTAQALTATSPLPRLRPQACRLCGARQEPAAQAVCAACLGPLEPAYDPHRRLPSREEIARRPPSLWRYREWLPVADPVHALDTGFTPLLDERAKA